MLLKHRLLCVLLASCIGTGLSAQRKLTMVHTGPHAREAHVKLKHITSLVTADTVFSDPSIKRITEQGFVLSSYRTALDSTVVPAYFGSGLDTTIITTRTVADSILVPFGSITDIRTSPLMHSGWAQAFAWAAVPAALGVVALPIGLMAEGAAIWSSWLAMEGTALGLVFLPMPLHLFDRRYRTSEGWSAGPYVP